MKPKRKYVFHKEALERMEKRRELKKELKKKVKLGSPNDIPFPEEEKKNEYT